MKDFSTILLMNTLRATHDYLQETAGIDQSSPGVKELKRMLLEQMLKLRQANRGDPRLTLNPVCGVSRGVH